MYRKYKSGYYSNNSIKYNKLTQGKSLSFTEDDEGLKVKLHQPKKVLYVNNKKNKYNNFDIDY